MADLAAEWLDTRTGLKAIGTSGGLVTNGIVPTLGDAKVTDIRRRGVIDMVEAEAASAPRSCSWMRASV